MNCFANMFIVITYYLITCAAELQLELLNVIFRHGDRTPTANAMFPKDPYYKSDFFPFGIGGLTSTGKSRTYKLGEFLQGRYKNFLGDVYLPELLYARSTDYDRTKMSLQLVLAALFPPANVQKWHDTLNWQPIPITYVAKPNDDLLGTAHQTKFANERERVEMKEDIEERLESFRGFMYELTSLTGKHISNSLEMKNIYDTLTSERFMNLTLPDWTNEMFPDGSLLDGILLDYDIISHDDNITSALSGNLMQKITNDILAATETTEKRKTKLFLYSGHEINIVGVLRSLNVYETHVPEYTSAVIIELLKENDNYYIKVLYYLGIPPNVIELQMPGCPVLCPLEKYLVIVNKILELSENEE